MINLTTSGGLRARQRSLGSLAAAFVLTVGTLAGCNIDKVLRVNDPDVATPSTLDGPSASPTLLNGAIADFHAAYTGTGDVNESSGQIGYSGLLADEIRSSDTFDTRNEVDARDIRLTNASNESQFRLIQRARASAKRAAASYAQYNADSAGHGEALALQGFAEILIGENYCSGAPFSEVLPSGELSFGTPLTTVQIFQDAVTQFDAALALPKATAAEKNLAAIGKGRALLNLGQYAAAATAVAAVPNTFVYTIQSSLNSTGQQNGVWVFFNNVRRLTLVNAEGINGLPYTAAADPRVPFSLPTSGGVAVRGFDKSTRSIFQQLYKTRDASAPLATGVEARLIEAEAALQANNPTLFVTKLQAARTATGLTFTTTITDPGTQTGRVNLLFQERAFSLFLTSHRLGDLRRLIRQYGRGAETVFPTGTFFKGGSYGTDVNFPLPRVEDNNPNVNGCLDRNA